MENSKLYNGEYQTSVSVQIVENSKLYSGEYQTRVSVKHRYMPAFFLFMLKLSDRKVCVKR